MSKTKGPGIASAASTGFPSNSINGSVSTSTLTFAASQIHYNNLVITSGADKLVSATVTTATNTPKTPTCKFLRVDSLPLGKANHDLAASTVSSPTKTGGAMAFASAPSAAMAGVVVLIFAVFA